MRAAPLDESRFTEAYDLGVIAALSVNKNRECAL
jgi:hypothetical protein